MNIVVEKMDPGIKVLNLSKLPGDGLFSRWPKTLQTGPGEMAVIKTGGRLCVGGAEGQTEEVGGKGAETLALIRTVGTARLVAPRRAAPLRVVVWDKDAQAALAPKETDLWLTLSEARFAGGVMGTASLWARVRILVDQSGGEHPLLTGLGERMDEAGLRQAIGRCVQCAVGQAIAGELARLAYRPGMAAADVSEALTRLFQGDAARDLARQGGLAFVSPVTATAACAPAVDDEELARKAAEQSAEDRRADLTSALAEVAGQEALAAVQGQKAMNDARRRHGVEMTEKAAELEKSRVDNMLELEARKKDLEKARMDILESRERASVETAIRLEKELAEQQLRVARAQAASEEARAKEQWAAAEERKAEAEQAQRKAEAIALDLETARRLADRQDQMVLQMTDQQERMAGELSARQNQMIAALDSKIAALGAMMDALKRAPKENPDLPLGLAVTWRAYNDDGIIIPQLGPAETLPSGTMLDVAVSASRDAHVYVALMNSRGEWQRLVPDDDGVMGIKRGNQQRAGEVVIWPGVNKVCPRLPHWCLDEDAGYERFVVVASVKPIPDIMKLLERDGVAGVRGLGGQFAARGVTNPAARLRARREGSRVHYRDVINTMVGDGCVVHETVIDHV